MTLASVFVYGTLKRGQLRESMWPRQPRSVTEALVRGNLYDLGPYPALLPPEVDSTGDTIEGEVWTFESLDLPEVLRVLDEIECYDQPGEPSLYIRAEITYETAADDVGTAFTYHFADRENLLRRATRIKPGADGRCRWPTKG